MTCRLHHSHLCSQPHSGGLLDCLLTAQLMRQVVFAPEGRCHVNPAVVSGGQATSRALMKMYWALVMSCGPRTRRGHAGPRQHALLTHYLSVLACEACTCTPGYIIIITTPWQSTHILHVHAVQDRTKASRNSCGLGLRDSTYLSSKAIASSAPDASTSINTLPLLPALKTHKQLFETKEPCKGSAVWIRHAPCS